MDENKNQEAPAKGLPDGTITIKVVIDDSDVENFFENFQRKIESLKTSLAVNSDGTIVTAKEFCPTSC